MPRKFRKKCRSREWYSASAGSDASADWRFRLCQIRQRHPDCSMSLVAIEFLGVGLTAEPLKGIYRIVGETGRSFPWLGPSSALCLGAQLAGFFPIG